MMTSNMIGKSLWLILSIHDTKVSADSIVSSLMIKSLLQESYELVIVSELLVVLYQIFEMIWMNYDILTTFLGKHKLFGSNT